jgi:hypothetical protein
MSEEKFFRDTNVVTLYAEIKTLIEAAGGPVGLNAVLLILATIGRQTDMDYAQFRTFVMGELDRLTAIMGGCHDL